MNFDRKVETYEKYAVVQKELASWTAEWLPKYTLNSNAIELGAGTGIFTDYLRHVHPELKVTDISNEMVKYGKAKYPTLEWKVMDGWSPICSNVDHIYSSCLLQWADDPICVLKNWYECLSANGNLLTVFFIDGTLDLLKSIGADISAIKYYDENEWLIMFRQAGFKVIRHKVKQVQTNYHSILDLFRSLHGMGAVKKNTINPVRLRQIIKNYESVSIDQNATSLNWIGLKVECCKK